MNMSNLFDIRVNGKWSWDCMEHCAPTTPILWTRSKVGIEKLYIMSLTSTLYFSLCFLMHIHKDCMGEIQIPIIPYHVLLFYLFND